MYVFIRFVCCVYVLSKHVPCTWCLCVLYTSPCSGTAIHPWRGSSYCLRDTDWGVTGVFIYSDTSMCFKEAVVNSLGVINPDVLDLIVGVCVKQRKEAPGVFRLATSNLTAYPH